MEPSDLGRVVRCADPQLSPDGRHVAFVVSRVDLAANAGRSAVWVAPTDGSAPARPFTNGQQSDGSPRWSPDGSLLAFTSRRGPDSEASLHVAPVGSGGETLTVATSKEGIGGITWSPDGRWLAYVARVPAPSLEPDPRARPPRRITRLVSRLDDEGWICDRPAQLHVTAADGTTPPRCLTDAPVDHGSPTWAPGSDRIAVTCGRHDTWDVDLMTDVVVVPLDGGDATQLTATQTTIHAVRWSPDGRHLAVIEEDPRWAPANPGVTVVDATTGARSPRTETLDRSCTPTGCGAVLTWLDARIGFLHEDRGRVVAATVPVEGEPTVETLVDEPDGCVTSVCAAAGAVAWLRTTPTELADVFVRDAAGQTRRITTIGADCARELGAVAPRRFVAERAGEEIDAWLFVPDHADAAASLPLLLDVHGGPFTQYSHAFFDEFQLQVSRGYAVLACNPRGSSGRTTEWGRSVRSPSATEHPGSGWGGDDVADVLAVLDAALALEPRVDPARIGMAGGSYGGWMATWLAATTDRFAAVCSERAANNLLTLEWSSDYQGISKILVGVDGIDSPDELLRMSPVTYARSITTPVLIIHSDDDLRCPPEQADQLFWILRTLGREVEYVRFAGEGHELSRSGSPMHRVQRAELFLDFFDRHLKAG